MAELYRPRLHLTAPFGWINDPNGFCFDGTAYHLYYQYNPADIVWGPMHWGHAESTDLLHWTDRGIVMAPDDLGAIFSGSGIPVPPGKTPLLPQGGLAFLFTHHGPDNTEMQSLAFSQDRGRTLIKYEGNPIIPNDGLADFRDPKVFWYEPLGCWCLITAGGPVRLYRSHDLIHWEMTCQLDAIQTECPDLFPLPYDGKDVWVLTTSGTTYYLGSFDGAVYTPEAGPFPVDFGGSFYAAQSLSGITGRSVWTGWMFGGSAAPTKRWRCAHTVPRELSLVRTPDGPRLHQVPVREMDALRGTPVCTALSAGTTAVLPVSSAFADLELTFPAGKTPRAEVSLFTTDTASCRVSYDGEAVSILRDGVPAEDYRSPFDPAVSFPLPWQGEELTLRILADASTLEVFGPADCTGSLEFYAPGTECGRLTCRAEKGRVKLTAWTPEE